MKNQWYSKCQNPILLGRFPLLAQKKQANAIRTRTQKSEDGGMFKTGIGKIRSEHAIVGEGEDRTSFDGHLCGAVERVCHRIGRDAGAVTAATATE